MDESKLEKKFLYRLTKVAYVIAFISIGAIIALLGWFEKPYQYTDYSKSYITCLPSNKTYTYDTVDKYINKVPNRYDLDLYDREDKASYVCEREIESSLKYREGTGVISKYNSKAEIFSEHDKDWFENTPENRKIIVDNVKNELPEGTYKVTDVYSTRGSWVNAILIWFLGIIILYVTLNILKETLFYILFGKRFSWDWVQSVWTFLNTE